jgi:hypothetical protein
MTMVGVEIQVMTTVNAPYGANLSAHQLAALIIDPDSAKKCNASAFAFFSEVAPALQKKFVKHMGLDEKTVSKVAGAFEKVSGYSLPLAA